MKVTQEMVQILINATAWNDKHSPLHRNGYESEDIECEELVELGLMREASNSIFPNHYVVTTDGIAYLLKRERKLRGAATKKAGVK